MIKIDKKSFFKGFAAGAAALALIFALFNGIALIKSVFGVSGVDEGNRLYIQSKIESIYGLLDKFYVEDVDIGELTDGMYSGFVDAVGDPYTVYMSEDEYAMFSSDNEGVFDGVGISVVQNTDDMSITVVSPIDDTPAAKAGILSGDIVIAVDGYEIANEKLNDVVKRIRGRSGTKVELTVFREKTGETLAFDLVRETISENTVSYKMLGGDIGYIRISQFKSNTYEQFKEAYEELDNKNQKGLIIDVRSNPGGLFDVVCKITDMLVPQGVYVYTEDKNGNKKEYASNSEGIKIPLCVLVDSGSASASEILAGAVQDMGAGKLVGTQTYGKGLVQNVYELSDGSAVKVTIQRYFTPSGVCIQGEGITPDYIAELPDNAGSHYTIEEKDDTQLNTAIDAINLQLKQ